MGKTKNISLGIYFLSLLFNVLYAQDSLTIESNIDGLVDYKLDLDDSSSFVFMLYGDGTFGTQKNPIHKFAASVDGYTSEAFIVKPYKPIKPPTKSIHTDSTGSGSPHVNPTISMSGQVDILTSWSPASGFENYFIIAFKNTSSRSPVDGCLDFYFNDTSVKVDTSQILEYNNWVNGRSLSSATSPYNKKISWTFSNLTYKETRYVYIPANVKTKSGNKLSLKAEYRVDCKDPINPINQNITEKTFLARTYPHDPNFKRSNLECLDPTGLYQKVNYTIGFFNDGNGFAKDVFITDLLPPELDHSSVNLLESEYTATWWLDGPLFHVNFMDIHLPGTEQTIPKIYSYEDCATQFTFEVCTNLPPYFSSCIINEAEIIFDTQPVFIAGPDVLCAGNDGCSLIIPCGSGSRSSAASNSSLVDSDFSFEIFPNPTQGSIKLDIQFTSEQEQDFYIDLLDYSGKIVKRLSEGRAGFENFEKQFYLDDVPKGVYLIVLQNGQERHLKKLIKQ